MPNRVRDSLRKRSLESQDFDGVLVVRDGRPYDPAWDLWRPVRRWPGILLSAVVTMVLIGVIAFHFEHQVAPPSNFGSNVIHAPLRGAYFPPVPDTAPGVQVFTGNASDNHVAFSSPGGLTTWTFQCRCRSNFAVTVRNALGNIIDVPVNEIGHTRLAATANYLKGSYTFDVLAQGKWKIRLIQESALPLVTTPFKYFSSGTSVLGPFPASSSNVVVDYIAAIGTYTTVQIEDAKNSSQDYFVFADQSGSKTASLPSPPNPFFLVVKSSGIWYVKVS